MRILANRPTTTSTVANKCLVMNIYQKERDSENYTHLHKANCNKGMKIVRFRIKG